METLAPLVHLEQEDQLLATISSSISVNSHAEFVIQGPPGTVAGEVGPTGNAGDQGRPGEQGPKGPRGPQGDLVWKCITQYSFKT